MNKFDLSYLSDQRIEDLMTYRIERELKLIQPHFELSQMKTLVEDYIKSMRYLKGFTFQKRNNLSALLNIFIEDINITRVKELQSKVVRDYKSRLKKKVSNSCYENVITEVDKFLYWLVSRELE